MAENARALRTYTAALALCRQGYGDPALMLVRSLFEGMAIAHWASEQEYEAHRRYDRHFRHTQILWHEKLHAVGWDNLVPNALEVSDDERDELHQLFGKYGSRLWTGHRDMYDLVAAIEHQWKNEASKAELGLHLRVAYHDANLILHCTPWALEQNFDREADGIVLEAGPSTKTLGRAIFTAFWTYSQTLTLLMMCSRCLSGRRTTSCTSSCARTGSKR